MPFHVQASGEFLPTLTAADVRSGRVELRALLNKARRWAMEGPRDIRKSLPFPLRGLDSDNGSEFINKALVKWRADEEIQFTRARPYHKNDNCFVEQKTAPCAAARLSLQCVMGAGTDINENRQARGADHWADGRAERPFARREPMARSFLPPPWE